MKNYEFYEMLIGDEAVTFHSSFFIPNSSFE